MATPAKRKRTAPQKSASVKRGPGPAVDYELLAQFRHQLRVFLAQSAKNAAKSRLTVRQYQALLAIEGTTRDRRMFVRELAQCLLIKHHTTVELVDRMAKLGLLRRTPDPDDNRRVWVMLTRKGAARLATVAKMNVQHLRRSSKTMSSIFKSFNRPRKRSFTGRA